MKNFILGPRPETESGTFYLTLEDGGVGQYDIVVTNESGRHTKLVGIRQGPKGFTAIRWLSSHDFDSIIDRDSAGRIHDTFKGDK